jgi:aryl-alcohol dehydrogenase-like predicted oxidoreductase
MRYRRVGDTELYISEIGFGCGGNAGLMVRGELRDQIRVVERALALGVTYFDNAPDYGDGRAEQNLGRALRELGVRQVINSTVTTSPVINSKVEIRAADLGDIAGHVVRSAEQSLTRLRIEHLDMFQVHNGPARSRPVPEGNAYRQLWIEDFLRPGGACDGIMRLKSAGKIRHAGFICRGDDADAVAALLDTGLFALINVPYTLLNPTAGLRKPAGLPAKDFGNVIEIAQRRAASAAIHSPLAGGLLTDAFLKGAPPHPLARGRDAASAATKLQRAQVARLAFLPDEGEGLAQVAYRFILSNAGVATVLGGFSAVEQVEELTAVSGRGPIAPDKLRRLEALWESNFEAELHPS